MKNIILLAVSSLLLTANIQAADMSKSVHSHEQKPKHLVHYFSVTGPSQTFTPTSATDPVFVLFDNDVVRSYGFEHPVNGDNTKFEVEHTGIYRVSYNVTFFPSGIAQNFFASLYLNGDLVRSSTEELQISVPRVDALSATTILKLKRGDILQLGILGSTGLSVTIDFVAMNASQIAED